jgi:uncharacterized protein YggT (Ycf19 family)
MAAQAQRNDTKLLFLKTARALTYIVYGFMVLAITFLSLGFVLLLFGANQDVAFTKFVYNVAAEFLQPFRGIFPLKPVGATGYFSTSALFAIMVYMFSALAVNSLITYVTAKMLKHQEELDTLQSK